MDEEDYIFKYKIKNYREVFDIINGRDNYNDLRGNFIFRGISDKEYELKPSSLRKNSKLNEFMLSKDMIGINIPKDIAVERGFVTDNQELHYINKDYIYLELDKYFKFPNGVELNDYVSRNELQIRKEITILMIFLNYADKCGLKVPFSNEIRKFIDNNQYYDNLEYWPTENFYELIALAQHYDVPTRFLDWSYDYKVSLYFAVKDILKFNEDDYKEKDGVLWGLNYNLFNIPFHKNNSNETFKLQFYRPEYNSNPNLSSQKGILTVILNDKLNEDKMALDKAVINDFHKNDKIRYMNNKMKRTHGFKTKDIPEGEKVFYKFIIPERFKAKILNELYNEGYSEEYLFPGYQSVTENIKNRVILDELPLKYK